MFFLRCKKPHDKRRNACIIQIHILVLFHWRNIQGIIRSKNL